MRLLGIFFTAAMLIGCTVAAGQQPDTATLQLRADQGDVQAQVELGLRYYDARDYVRSADWMLTAANQGDDLAQLTYGFMVMNGQGMAADAVAGAQWIRRSAEQGNSTAQDMLSTLYSNGTGVPQDDSAALEWASRGAEQGDPRAQYSAGFYLCCKFPSSIAHDEVTAAVWFVLSDAAGHPKSRQFLVALGAELSDAQKAEADRRVKEWLRTHKLRAYRGGNQ